MNTDAILNAEEYYRPIFYAYIMESSIIDFTRDRLLMLFMCAVYRQVEQQWIIFLSLSRFQCNFYSRGMKFFTNP